MSFTIFQKLFHSLSVTNNIMFLFHQNITVCNFFFYYTPFWRKSNPILPVLDYLYFDKIFKSLSCISPQVLQGHRDGDDGDMLQKKAGQSLVWFSCIPLQPHLPVHALFIREYALLAGTHGQNSLLQQLVQRPAQALRALLYHLPGAARGEPLVLELLLKAG